MNESAESADTCALCGKDISGGRGFMRLFVEGRPVELCCPMCLKVFQDRQAQRETEQRSGEGRYLGWDEKW
jgi:ribosomal protein L24E